MGAMSVGEGWTVLSNMALLAEGGASRHRFYKHRPPGGERARLATGSINMAS